MGLKLVQGVIQNTTPIMTTACSRAPGGHQGTAAHGRGVARRPSLNHRWNHSAARPPRFLPDWQRRIAAFFTREVS